MSVCTPLADPDSQESPPGALRAGELCELGPDSRESLALLAENFLRADPDSLCGLGPHSQESPALLAENLLRAGPRFSGESPGSSASENDLRAGAKFAGESCVTCGAHARAPLNLLSAGGPRGQKMMVVNSLVKDQMVYVVGC